MELPLILKAYDAYKALVDITSRLEKRWRYVLGVRCENQLLNLLENLVMAKHAPKAMKAAYLLKVIAALESVRFELRLFLDVKAVKNETNVFKLQAMLEEIGKMAGGWLRSLEK
jgi:hypothetical protein